MKILQCSSMAHVIDRSVAFRFCDNPYECASVTPNSVTLYRHNRDARGRLTWGIETIRFEVKS